MIERVGHNRVRIGYYRSKTAFVPLNARGDEVEVRITRNHRKGDEAELVRLMKSYPLRREPSCPHYGRYVGCQLQHIKLYRQRDLKDGLFRKLIIHDWGVAEKWIGEIFATSEELRYRSRLEMHLL